MSDYGVSVNSDNSENDSRCRSRTVSRNRRCSDDNGPRQKKRKMESGYDFIIREAEVDDESDDDEQWEEVAEEIGIDGNAVEEIGLTARDIEGKRRATKLWEEEDEIDEHFTNKYFQELAVAHSSSSDIKKISDIITQQELLPSVKDPSLWMVKCRIGEEKATALLMMRKFLTYQFSGEPLQIKSVVVPGGLKGFIYIEAYKQSHMMAAIQNVGSLRMGTRKQQMVPIVEMADVLRIINKQTGLKVKQWVRPKRGLYKDAIAQVHYVNLAEKQVNLKLLPRNDSVLPRGERFLYKKFSMNAIISEGVKPTLSELEKFEETPDEVDIELNDAPMTGVSAGQRNQTVAPVFTTGDNVEVCEGELKNLTGKIVSTDGAIIKVIPNSKDFKQIVEFKVSELRKYFTVGAQVKVIAGRYKDDTGLVVRVEQNHIVLFAEQSLREIEVLPRDLQLCSSSARPGGGGGPSGGGGRGGGRGAGARRHRELIGSTIKITGGPYKGYVGIVRIVTEAMARVELHSNCQTITVARSHVATVGEPNKKGGFSHCGRTPAYGIGSKTPMYSSNRTPMHGSQTPRHGSMKPSHYAGDAWDATVRNTPARNMPKL